MYILDNKIHNNNGRKKERKKEREERKKKKIDPQICTNPPTNPLLFYVCTTNKFVERNLFVILFNQFDTLPF